MRMTYADLNRRRDDEWARAYRLVRQAVETEGGRCRACGGHLWDRAGTGRIYCDDTCRRRHTRRRERLREFLRRHEAPCQLCGHDA